MSPPAVLPQRTRPIFARLPSAPPITLYDPPYEVMPNIHVHVCPNCASTNKIWQVPDLLNRYEEEKRVDRLDKTDPSDRGDPLRSHTEGHKTSRLCQEATRTEATHPQGLSLPEPPQTPAKKKRDKIHKGKQVAAWLAWIFCCPILCFVKCIVLTSPSEEEVQDDPWYAPCHDS